ncbi:hypothetical protein LWI28_013780 [Acer negundo]|uniref:GAG-pre-integrase domain-containing protein n=1 Tax=Acer negundo TaxID=4023 RepID=A0AAD5IVA8_ACENE|nr:hypothetical protein LWI28_013780 [Acer negundo]
MQFMMGLNDSYSAIRGQILLMNPLPSVRQAYSSVSQEEKQHLLSAIHDVGDPSSRAAMTVRSKPNSDLAMRRMIGLGKQHDGLYYLAALATKKSAPTKRPACNLTISSTNLWHNRLGHASPPRLSFIAKNFLKFLVQSNKACHICPLAKQSRLPFSPSTKKVFTSRDVRFHENFFAYASIKPIFPSYTEYGPILIVAYDISSSFYPNPNPSQPHTSPVVSPSSLHLLPASILSPSSEPPPPHRPSPQLSSSPTPSPPSPSHTLSPPSPDSSSPPSPPPIPSSDFSTNPLPTSSPQSLGPDPDLVPLRGSSRQTDPPAKLSDYVCNTVCSDQSPSLLPGPTKGTCYPLANHVSYH